jgi:predicted nucleotidyltransferase
MDTEYLLKQFRRIKGEIRAKFGVNKIGFFNCYMDTHHNHECELNVLVELEKPLGWKFFELKEFIEDELQIRIDICTERSLKPALRDEILSEIRYV